MAQFQLNWDSTDAGASGNTAALRPSSRYRSEGGEWNESNFDPPGPLPADATSVVSDIFDDNKVVQFKISTECEQNGPVDNDGGIREAIGFTCIIPDLTPSANSIGISFPLANTDITKVRIGLRKVSDNTLAYGPNTITRTGDVSSVIVTGLTPGIEYYVESSLIATVGGIEVNSSSVNNLNSVCGPVFVTTESVEENLIWIPLAKHCQKDNPFGIYNNITGLSSPVNTWYDAITGNVYVADHDDPNGNVYWFDYLTALTLADMTHSSAIVASDIYNSYIDGENRKIYFVGANTNGMLVYSIADDTVDTVSFGTNGPFQRTSLFVLGDRIYCNNGTTEVVIIDRTTLAVINTVTVASIPTPSRFNTGPYNLERVGDEIFVVSFNASVGTLGVYDLDLTTEIASVVLPSVATWVGGKYWQTMFYDAISGQLYIADTGASSQYIINPTTHDVIDTRFQVNLEGKTNVLFSWLLDPITNELYGAYIAQDTTSDGTPIKRMYVEDRSNFQHFKDMTDIFFIQRASGIPGTSYYLGSATGLLATNELPGWDTDGSITVLSSTISGGNTTLEIVDTLQEVDANNSDEPTGETKNNIFGEDDYIAPAPNLDACPLTATLTCPIVVTTQVGATLRWEFSLLDSVINNPNVVKLEIYAYNINTASIEGSPSVALNPSIKFFRGNFIGLGGINYTIQVKMFNAFNVEIQSC